MEPNVLKIFKKIFRVVRQGYITLKTSMLNSKKAKLKKDG